MSTISKPERKVTPPPADNPWYYGWRDVLRTLPDGTTKFEQIPLTLEDALHPQQGDHIMESDQHDFLRTYLATVFRWRTKDDPEALILSDVGVYWEDPTLDFTHHCPDVCAIFGIKKRKPVYPSFFVRKEGVRPRLIVELVSPNTRNNDVVTKVEEYHRVEIPVYVIADRRSHNDPWKLLGYVWRPDQYIPIPTDLDGRLWLDAVGLWLGAEDTRLVCYDRDGKEISDYIGIRKQLDTQVQITEAEKQRAEAEKQRAEAQTQRADAEKQRADAQAQRADVEKQRADQEAKARAELEAELARLRGQ